MFAIQQWQILLLISSSLLILACNSNSSKELKESVPKMKAYSYIEILSKDGMFVTDEIEEKESVEIQQTSDSLAYLEAFQKFYIS